MKRASFFAVVLMMGMTLTAFAGTVQEDFFAAVRRNDVEDVKKTISSGADVNEKDKDGFTAMVYAAHYGMSEVAKVLLYFDANPNMANQYGMTPLMYAAAQNQVEMGKMLVNKGAKVDQQDNNGSTPLILAAFNGNREMVKFLLERGANANKRDKWGMNAGMIAWNQSYDDIAKTLADAGAQFPEGYGLDTDESEPVGKATKGGEPADDKYDTPMPENGVNGK